MVSVINTLRRGVSASFKAKKRKPKARQKPRKRKARKCA
jgi:hypothetical protein